MAEAVGIDLGTTFSLVAHLRSGRPEIISNAEGDNLTPSVVAFMNDGTQLVGRPAREQACLNPDRTVFSIKRRMGRLRYPLLGRLTGDWEAGQVKGGILSDVPVMIDGRGFTPEEISAMILKKLKVDAERRLGEKVEKAVISVPAYFNIRQRQATLDAGRAAGLDVLRIMDEPTAAALAYGLEVEDIHTVLVWDLGGGTFDVSVLELGRGVFSVKSVNGDTRLGGDDYDLRVMNYLMEKFRRKHGIDLSGDGAAMAMLREAAENAKIELSAKDAVEIRLPLFEAGKKSFPILSVVMTREKFEDITSDLLQRMIRPTMQALSDAGLQQRDIDRAILVGGSARMPRVKRLFRELTGKDPCPGISPDEAVALGAAIQAGILTGEIKGKVLVDVTSISLGIQTEGGIFTKLIERNTPIPASKSRIFTNAADNQTSLSIHVLQGEMPQAEKNTSIGCIDMDGIFPLPRGQALIEVRFDINSNGILNVSAADLHTSASTHLSFNLGFHGQTEVQA